jgi:glycosyltransferase involved in cell wall biosynthesis
MDDATLTDEAAGDARLASELPTVLHLIGTLDRGGTEHQLVELIRRSTHPERHLVMTWAGGGALVDQLPRPPVWSAPPLTGGRARAGLRVARALRRVIDAHGVELVHAHLSGSDLIAWLGTPRDVPIVASRRGRLPSYEDRGWFRAVQRLAHRRVQLMLTNSEELASFTRRHDPSPPPMIVIPNGVDLDRWRASPLPSEPVVVVVANLIHYKRHDLFLRAFAMAVADRPDAQAIFVGDGPERPTLELLAADLGIRGRVHFVGETADPRPFVARARVVALTSDHEGLPNALLEGMAAGRPVVARDVGGIPELVTNGREGWLTGPDPSEIADRLGRVLTENDGVPPMAAAARRRAEGFGWATVVRRTEDVYRRAAAGERFAPSRESY